MLQQNLPKSLAITFSRFSFFSFFASILDLGLENTLQMSLFYVYFAKVF